MIKKPMLAVNCKELSKIEYPCLLSPKLDGIRCLKREGQIVSRTFKPIPNKFINTSLRAMADEGFDGELVTTDDDGNVEEFNTIQGNVMRIEGRPNFQLLVFDNFMSQGGFRQRYEELVNHVAFQRYPVQIRLVPHVVCNSLEQLEDFEEHCVAAGYEGIMIRHQHGQYKQGRSTEKQQWLLKVKRFEDIEGFVTSITEELDADGRAKGSLGAIKVATREFGGFSVGSGFSAMQRRDYFDNPDLIVGKVVTIKYQPSGMKDKPRFPTFKGIRDPIDISF